MRSSVRRCGGCTRPRTPPSALSYRRGIARGDTSQITQIHEEHQQIVEAFDDGDHERAVLLLAAHRAGGQHTFHHYLAVGEDSGEIGIG
jgi:DNA-binding GntR family transcriptional regulator